MEFKILTILLSMLIAGHEFLLARYFADFSWTVGALFLLPVSLLGIAFGALVMAIRPGLRARFEGHIFEWAVFGAALAWLALPFNRTALLTPALAAISVSLSFFANVILSAALTRLLQRQTVTSWLMQVTLGAALALGLPLALEKLSAPFVTLIFFLGAAIVLAGLGVRRPRVLALTLIVLVAGLYWNGINPPADTVFTPKGAVRFERIAKPIAGYRIELNHQRVFTAWDPETSQEAEIVKGDELFALLGLNGKGRIAIVNSIGGTELLQARLAGFKDITAVEATLDIASALKSRLRRPEFSVSAPEVKWVESDARHFFRMIPDTEKFDTIVINGGAFGRSLFTREGIAEVAAHLNPRGILIVRLVAEPSDFLTGLEYSLLAGLGNEAEGEGEQLLRMHREKTGSTTTFAYRKKGFQTVKKGLDRIKDRLKMPMNFVPVEPTAGLMEWPRAFNDDRPYTHGLKTSKIILGGLALFAGLLLLGLMRMSAGPLMAGSYLSGLGILGLQTMALEWVAFAAGEAVQAPLFVLGAFAISAAVGLWRALRRGPDEQKSVLSSLYLRAVLSGILAFYLIRHLNDFFTDSTWISLLGSALCLAPAYFAAQALSIQLILIKPGGERATAYWVATFALGLALGGVIVKLVALTLGQSAATAAVIGFFFLASVVFSEERPSPFASIPLSLPG